MKSIMKKKDGIFVLHSKLISTTNCIVEAALQVLFIGLKTGLTLNLRPSGLECPYKAAFETTLFPLLEGIVTMETFSQTCVPEFGRKTFHALSHLLYSKFFIDIKKDDFRGKESNAV